MGLPLERCANYDLHQLPQRRDRFCQEKVTLLLGSTIYDIEVPFFQLFKITFALFKTFSKKEEKIGNRNRGYNSRKERVNLVICFKSQSSWKNYIVGCLFSSRLLYAKDSNIKVFHQTIVQHLFAYFRCIASSVSGS